MPQQPSQQTSSAPSGWTPVDESAATAPPQGWTPVDDGAQKPGFLSRAYSRLSQNIVTPLTAIEKTGNAIFDRDSPERAETAASLKNFGKAPPDYKAAFQSLPPVQVGMMAKDWYHDPANLAGDAATAAILHTAGSGAEKLPTSETAEAAEGAAKAPTAMPSGMLGRLWEVGKRRAMHLPGVQAAKDVDYVVRGDPDAAPPAPPAPPTPKPPESWGKGQFGTPIDQWGKRVPAESQPAAATPPQTSAAPDLDTAKQLTRKSLQQMLDEQLQRGLGASPPPNPKEPIYPRVKAAASPTTEATDVPQGHTAHQSSALTSTKYDPAAREFHVKYAGGGNTIHVFGDVSPEEAAAFDQAKSKGAAMQQIKRAHEPPVAKIINGQRVAVKPTR